MSKESEIQSNGLYLIKGKFYGNICKCQQSTYYGNPILKITFAKGATLNYNPSDALLTDSEKSYATRSWTLVDFILYNKTTKQPVLAIEVDGMAFHKAGSEQSKRDILKDSVLKKSNIPLLRLSTDGSNEKNRIIEALNCTYS